MRYSDRLSPSRDIIAAHREKIARHESAWLGKFGKPIGDQRITLLNGAVGRGEIVSLYLATKAPKGWTLSRGDVLAVAKELPPKDRRLVPSYYATDDLERNVSVWFHLASLEDEPSSTLERLTVVRSGGTARYALLNSMSGFFFVWDESGARARQAGGL